MSSEKEAKYDGQKVRLGGQDYIVPPLNFRPLRTDKELIALISEFQALTLDQMKKLDLAGTVKYSPIVFTALKRNYPELELETFLDGIDLRDLRSGEYSRAFLAAMGISDADTKAAETVGEAGEAQAVAG